MGYQSNIQAVIGRLRGAGDRFAAPVGARIAKVTAEVTKGVLSRTPVHTGKAIGNFVWSQGTPRFQNAPAAGSGDPGPTGSMPLGSEPRRPANEARVWATHAKLKFKRPFGRYYLANGDEKINDLERGLLPTPDRSRSPGGMIEITVAQVKARMGLGQL